MPPLGKKPHVLIVGGGITGLTAAYTLERETNLEITLLEASHRLGGVIQTERREGFVIEEGPDSLFTGKPEALDLIQELGLENEVIEPSAKGFSVLVGNQLYPVPSGLVGLSGIDPAAIKAADYLSEEGKTRALNDQPFECASDLSISEFFSHRYGPEFSDKVAEPLLAGTHAGDPARLSMRALFPRFLEPRLVSQAKGASFVSLRQGMATLIDSLRESLTRTEVTLCDRIWRIERSLGGYTVWKEEAPTQIRVDHLLLATPAGHASDIVKGIAPEAAQLLKRIPYESSTVATVMLEAAQLKQKLSGTGFLVPPRSDSLLKGCTYSSSKWPGRAPAGTVVVRFFLSSLCTDQELKEQIRRALLLIGAEGEAMQTSCRRWENAFPQYNLGHLELVDKIEGALAREALTVAGSSYRGVGIPDCIRQGREAAREISRRLA